MHKNAPFSKKYNSTYKLYTKIFSLITQKNERIQFVNAF